MGIFGSELHTWALPARVGTDVAESLLSEKLPLGAARAQELGLVDAVGPRDPEEFATWLAAQARAAASRVPAGRAEGSDPDAAGRPLSYYRTVELAEMARDLFDDRHGFAARRQDFLRKAAPSETPARLRFARD
jgi:putative two-component system hydrogenase maturation factor HypX/HoxX